MTIEINQVSVQVYGDPGLPVKSFCSVFAQVMSEEGEVQRDINSVFANVLGDLPPAVRQINQVYLNILCSRTPKYGFNSVILTDVFPFDISYQSVGSVRFATDVIIVDSGDDQRVGRWDQPLMEYDIAYGVRTMEQLIALIAFFRAMRGRLYAFNYRDNVDYTSSIPVAYEARRAPAITPLDQFIAVGDGSTYVFQLTKTYATATQSQVRPIVRPEPGTTSVAINDITVANWTVDDTTGLVSFTSPYSQTFGALTKAASGGVFNEANINGVAGEFNGFIPYIQGSAPCVQSKVTMTGWAKAGNNIAVTQTANIVGVNNAGAQLVVQYPAQYGIQTDAASGVTIAVHPAPANGLEITAGYQFFVPCRFDTDILPVTLEDYGVGSSNSIKLIEVRPSAF